MSDQQFDVFLCHNSKEKSEVERIREQLVQKGIYAWLDKYDFAPFRPWQEQLDEIIPQIKAAAIFLGSSGVGPWADIEMREFLVEFAKRKIRMGLVILPGCSDELIQAVPRFLRSFQWVDFRESNPDPMEQLIWGITGEKPPPGNDPPDPDPNKGVNYSELENLLKNQQWREADSKTCELMHQAISESRIEVKHLKNYPDTVLKKLDTLWAKYSHGKFGFGAQAAIWQELNKNEDAFDIRVGWRLETASRQRSYAKLSFDLSSAPPGHLPAFFKSWGGGGWSWRGYILSRALECGLPQQALTPTENEFKSEKGLGA